MKIVIYLSYVVFLCSIRLFVRFINIDVPVLNKLDIFSYTLKIINSTYEQVPSYAKSFQLVHWNRKKPFLFCNTAQFYMISIVHNTTYYIIFHTILEISILQSFYLHELVNQFSISMYIFLIIPEPVLTLYYIVLPVFVQKFCFVKFVYQLKPYSLGI